MARFELRLSDEDRVRWGEVASADGLPLSIFIRRCVEDQIEQRAGGSSHSEDRALAEDSILAPAQFDHHVETGDQPKITRTLRPSQLELDAEAMDDQDRPSPFAKKG